MHTVSWLCRLVPGPSCVIFVLPCGFSSVPSKPDGSIQCHFLQFSAAFVGYLTSACQPSIKPKTRCHSISAQHTCPRQPAHPPRSLFAHATYSYTYTPRIHMRAVHSFACSCGRLAAMLMLCRPSSAWFCYFQQLACACHMWTIYATVSQPNP